MSLHLCHLGGVHQGQGAGADLRGRCGHEQVRGLLRLHHHALRHGQVGGAPCVGGAVTRIFYNHGELPYYEGLLLVESAYKAFSHLRHYAKQGPKHGNGTPAQR